MLQGGKKAPAQRTFMNEMGRMVCAQIQKKNVSNSPLPMTIARKRQRKSLIRKSGPLACIWFICFFLLSCSLHESAIHKSISGKRKKKPHISMHISPHSPRFSSFILSEGKQKNPFYIPSSPGIHSIVRERGRGENRTYDQILPRFRKIFPEIFRLLSPSPDDSLCFCPEIRNYPLCWLSYNLRHRYRERGLGGFKNFSVVAEKKKSLEWKIRSKTCTSLESELRERSIRYLLPVT